MNFPDPNVACEEIITPEPPCTADECYEPTCYNGVCGQNGPIEGMPCEDGICNEYGECEDECLLTYIGVETVQEPTCTEELLLEVTINEWEDNVVYSYGYTIVAQSQRQFV